MPKKNRIKVFSRLVVLLVSVVCQLLIAGDPAANPGNPRSMTVLIQNTTPNAYVRVDAIEFTRDGTIIAGTISGPYGSYTTPVTGFDPFNPYEPPFLTVIDVTVGYTPPPAARDRATRIPLTLTPAGADVVPNDIHVYFRKTVNGQTGPQRAFKQRYATNTVYLADQDPVYVWITDETPQVTGYNTYGVAAGATALLLAGGYLLFRKKRKFASIRIQDKQ